MTNCLGQVSSKSWESRIKTEELGAAGLGVDKIPWFLREGRGGFKLRSKSYGLFNWLHFRIASLWQLWGAWANRMTLEASSEDGSMTWKSKLSRRWWKIDNGRRSLKERWWGKFEIPGGSRSLSQFNHFPFRMRRKALFLFWALDGGGVNGSWQLSLPSEA